MPRVVILGAGPAGLGAAYRLAQRRLARVTVLEANGRVGGNAGSFEIAGQPVDYGSHRLHHACDPEVLRDIRSLLGDDLLDRPRHGRIRMRGRWIHFPLKPLDLALRSSPTFTLGVTADLVRKLANGRSPSGVESFASVLEAGLGRTICRDFYFPYARKIWGLAPEELSAAQARRRVSANSLGKMLRKALSAASGASADRKGSFYYPRRGFGSISEAYYQGAREAGADVQLGARVRAVETVDGAVSAVRYERDGGERSVHAGFVWSTIPVTTLARCLEPAAPEECLTAAASIDYRAMILVYLVLEQERFSEFDAHYFPEADVPITRLSEPKNYAGGCGLPGLTVLCAELPCAPDGPEWAMTDDELGRLVRSALAAAGVPVHAPVRQVATRRLRHAYPIYRRGYEAHFDRLDRWIGQIDGLLTFGRQGLFAHDNTHHALYMAYCAVDCLDQAGRFDGDRWQAYRHLFETHVVED